ncbi:virulence factor Mce family protein [Mycobacterium sp. CVI_P3]|uniref:Virulence factor Mce family protein n=1 Tax=Mycobacterium pinniadriaticum TaxID=2994102 RepID=A0ABT3SKP9_9MYCO|nr:virulence factor Mce family protein [Mycobacterium pinniadriaticum]MCX2933679.1 virulence factor Mce family protein [Mycobacterium pinniadriaticum]MCX2940101.1 virulence factor Mce family protein [Mycobacterium pinniadriaticum]
MRRTGRFSASALILLALVLSGCGWQGVNSLPLPGTVGRGPGSFTVQAQLPDVDNIERNSRVRVGDVTVGNVEKIERQGWHALLTMTINGDVNLPANATAKVGQTSLLGSKHIELAPPKGVAPEGKLHDGSLIPLTSSSAYPTTEQTLAQLSMLLNGGGIGQIQDITQALSVAFAGREQDLRSLIQQLDIFITFASDQTDDIIRATQSLDNLVGQFAEQKPVVDKALKTLPQALSLLKDERQKLADALGALGKFSAVAADAINQTKDNLVKELEELGPVLESLANAGPALTRSLSFFGTFPWPNETLEKWARGDTGNITTVIDLTLSRIDAAFFTGTRFEGNLTELEMQWGRTIGQMPSPYTAGNPLVAPYHLDQRP